MTILKAENLVKIYGKRRVVNNVSVFAAKGEIVGLLGPNGAGKTTTFYMITGMIRPDGGKIFLNEHEITRKPMYKRARLGIGYLSQEASVFRKLTVEDNLRLVLEMMGLSRQEIRDETDRLLDEFHIQHIRKNKAFTLSGGERRRIEIARALASKPDFILLDEPFGSLDALTREKKGSELLRIWQATRKTVIMVTHSIFESLMLADRVLVLSQLPARIKLDLKVDLPRPRGEEERYSKKFRDLSHKLHDAIEM